jgi:hypothetical protein
MATCKLVRFEPLKDAGRFFFGDVAPSALANDLATFFIARGYKLEMGTPFAGRYGIGSDVMRMLFGAFAKRYVFDFSITGEAGNTQMEISKAISGAMGGVIGYKRMNKELATVLADLQTTFA